ncbi:hypothetical protein SAMN05443247_08191 [Bradyrhizobium erythrophlei]|nr:hypothetical protein SAMN05443247_08191 [Bradyrhizobium erythrophlei]
MTANSVRPNGWRSASSRVPTRSRGPRRHSRNFKRQPAALQHKPLRRLKRVGCVRQPFKTDGRSVSLRLTSKGKKALARDPFEVLVRAVDSLDATERTAMRRALHQVLSTLATSGAHRRFGVCQDCTYFGREICGNLPSTGPSAAECLFLGVPIQPEDVGLLCVHFQPMNEHHEDRRTP